MQPGTPFPMATVASAFELLVTSYQNHPRPSSLRSWVLTITAQPVRSPPSVNISFTAAAPTGCSALAAFSESDRVSL